MPEKNLCVPFVGPLGISFTFYRFSFYVFKKKVERNFFPMHMFQFNCVPFSKAQEQKHL